MSDTLSNAKDLLQFAAGPSIVGVGALLAYATNVYNDDKRVPAKGWLALGAGVVLFVWIVLFIGLAIPTLWRSWTGTGTVEPILVLLNATATVAICLGVVIIWHTPKALDYLRKSYDPESLPRLLRSRRRPSGEQKI